MIYPSDYGYATNGGNLGRKACFDKELYSWDSTDGNYQSECVGTNWLKPSSSYLWTLAPNSSRSTAVFGVLLSGSVVIGNGSVYYAYQIWPTLYLKSSVKITPNQNPEQEYGSVENPFQLSNEL